MANKEMNEARLGIHRAKAHLDYHLEVFGDYLAKKQGYKSAEGMEAVWFYLCQKYHWTPAAVRALNGDDIRFLLQEEMVGWTLPKDAIFK